MWRLSRLTGLATGAVDPSNALHLYFLSNDPTSRLHHFWTSLIDSFSVAGFPVLRPQEPRVKIVDSIMVHWSKSGAYKKANDLRPPVFDARGLIETYEHTVWAKDVHLQRLSLFGVGISGRLPNGGRVYKEPPEIHSVALP